MIKMILLSMLSGLVALLMGVHLFYSSPTEQGQPHVLAWSAADIHVEIGTGEQTGGNLLIQLNEDGRAIIALPVPRLKSENYPLLHLAFADTPEDIGVTILWRAAATGNEVHSYRVPGPSRRSLWLTARELQDWSGDITSLGVVLLGQAGDTVTITEVSVSPTSLSRRLQAIYADWAGFSPWRHSSVNDHPGRSTVASFFPVPVFAILFALSLLAYAILLFLLRENTHFDWRVVAGIFLTCWISLDLLWQQKLLRQLAHTYETFSGKDTRAKLAAGLDANLVDFAGVVKKKIESPDARIFVSSKDDYRGMRSAYYLYPFNVYWKRHGRELPRREYLRSGDYIALVEPTDTRFDPLKKDIHSPHLKGSVSVEPVFSHGQASLYRVK